MRMLRYGVLLFFALIAACGRSNTDAPALDATNKHPATWLAGHRGAFLANPVQCRECHGIDLKGGITKIDCFNQGGLATCHVNGHGPRTIIHAVPFVDPQLHGKMAAKDLVICQDCHGTSGGAGSNPRFNVLIGSLATGCEASGCHLPLMAHPKPWKTHGAAGNQANACALCHGAIFGGGSGPACKNCHKMLATGALPVAGQCNSCHGSPPSGSAPPNTAGSHATHAALPELQGNCGACHEGGGYGTPVHYSFSNHTAAKVSFRKAYDAKSGVAVFSRGGKSCTNVKCHGGQTTQAWGTIMNPGTECLKCHAPGTAQYNGYFSGRHGFHLSQGLFCTDCHDMSSQSLPGHFSNLSSASFNQSPSRTIRGYLNYNSTAQPPTCFITTAPPAGTQFTACHSDRRSW